MDSICENMSSSILVVVESQRGPRYWAATYFINKAEGQHRDRPKSSGALHIRSVSPCAENDGILELDRLAVFGAIAGPWPS